MRLPRNRLLPNAARLLLILILPAAVHCFFPVALTAADCGGGQSGGGYTVPGEIVQPAPVCPAGMPTTAQYWYDPDNPPAGMGPMSCEDWRGNRYIVDTLWPPGVTLPGGYPDETSLLDCGWSFDWIPYTDLGGYTQTYHVVVVAPDASDVKSRDELCTSWEDGF